MKNITVKIFKTLLLLFSLFTINAQDIEFSQFYATKNYLNPAFTSLTHDQSISSTYRNQWPGIKNAYDSYFVSFDRRIKGKEAGFGFYYLGDLAGEGALLKQSLGFQYAKQFRFSKNIYASFGIKGSYNSISIKWDRLVWGDMLDARKGISYTTQQQQGAPNENYFDSGSGFIVYSDHLQGGISVEHMNRPKQGLLAVFEENRMPIRYKLHVGGNVPIQTIPNAPLVKISPQLIYTKQGNSSQTAIGAYVTYTLFTFGVWHRLKDSMIFLVGMKKDAFQIGYSYDLGVNKLISHSGGAHEISLTYGFDFHNKTKQRKYRTISCPVF